MSVSLFNRLERLDYLIRSRSTGTPQQLARRLEISERAVYDFLNEMRELGAPICYSKRDQTYYYTEKGEFSFKFRKVG